MIPSSFASSTLTVAASMWTQFGLTNYLDLIVGVLLAVLVVSLLVRAFHH